MSATIIAKHTPHRMQQPILASYYVPQFKFRSQPFYCWNWGWSQPGGLLSSVVRLCPKLRWEWHGTDINMITELCVIHTLQWYEPCSYTKCIMYAQSGYWIRGVHIVGFQQRGESNQAYYASLPVILLTSAILLALQLLNSSPGTTCLCLYVLFLTWSTDKIYRLLLILIMTLTCSEEIARLSMCSSCDTCALWQVGDICQCKGFCITPMHHVDRLCAYCTDINGCVYVSGCSESGCLARLM